MVLLPVEPYWAHAYWVLSSRMYSRLTRRRQRTGGRIILRFHAISMIHWSDRRRWERFDVELSSPSGNYYLNLWSPGHSVSAEIGILGKHGAFTPVLESNRVELPRSEESSLFEDVRVPLHGEGDGLWKPRAGPAAAAEEEEDQEPHASSDSEQTVARGDAIPSSGSRPWALRPDRIFRSDPTPPAPPAPPEAAPPAAREKELDTAGAARAGAPGEGEGPAPPAESRPAESADILLPSATVEPPEVEEVLKFSQAASEVSQERRAEIDEETRRYSEAALGEVEEGVAQDTEGGQPSPTETPWTSGDAIGRAILEAFEAGAAEHARPSVRGLSSGLFSSWGISSLRSSPGDDRPRFEIHADLVLYGRAQPGSEWVIEDQVVKVRDDGSFEIRFALPPGNSPAPSAPRGTEPEAREGESR